MASSSEILSTGKFYPNFIAGKFKPLHWRQIQPLHAGFPVRVSRVKKCLICNAFFVSVFVFL